MAYSKFPNLLMLINTLCFVILQSVKNRYKFLIDCSVDRCSMINVINVIIIVTANRNPLLVKKSSMG